jgi:hypothetical protein
VIVRFTLDPNNLPELPASDLARIDAMTDADIDYSDIPELDDEFFKNAAVVSVPPEEKKPRPR